MCNYVYVYLVPTDFSKFTYFNIYFYSFFVLMLLFYDPELYFDLW